MPAEKITRLHLQKLGFTVSDGAPRGEGPAEFVASVRLISLLDQKVMVIASLTSVAPVAIIERVSIFHRDPFPESVLGEDFIPQVPLAHICRVVIQIVHQLRKAGDVGGQWNIVLDAPGRVRPQARHNGRPVGRANRLGDVGPLEHDAFSTQLIEIGCMNANVAVGRHGVGPLLIGPEEQQVGLIASSSSSRDAGTTICCEYGCASAHSFDESTTA